MKTFFATLFAIAISHYLQAQGCSDAGFCTAGNFNDQHQAGALKPSYKNEIDLVYNYGTHGKNEKFYQPQLNYRFINKNNTTWELRLPYNTAKNTATGISNSGIGDVVATYNHSLRIGTQKNIAYSIGLRVSLSDAIAKAKDATTSYPMYLQAGLGTTDLIAVANYDIIKYLSIGAGVQLPILQYNQNKIRILQPGYAGGFIIGEGYRRQPDALLKLTGHYALGKLKLNGTVLGIFHLANDYYNIPSNKYYLIGSKGSTINLAAECSYAVSTRLTLGLLYASPIKTRTNIPDGLARSSIFSPKFSFRF